MRRKDEAQDGGDGAAEEQSYLIREDLEPEKLFVRLQCKSPLRVTPSLRLRCIVLLKPGKALISHLGWY